MEIRLTAGDKINIPENCKATIEDNQIIIEEQKEEFKDGDILKSNYNEAIIIFKAFDNDGKMLSYSNNYADINDGWLVDSFRHATEKEKQAFFDELKAKGLRWNAETKAMEKIRERAEKGEDYFYINEKCEAIETEEDDSLFDDRLYNLGNYYLLSEREQAEEDAKSIKAIFEKRLKAK